MSSDPLLNLDAFVNYTSDIDKANQALSATTAALLASPNTLDFFSFTNPTDVLAPHPDLFESELDSSLAQLDDSQLSLSFLDVDAPADPFAFLRSDTPTHGYRSTPSVVTASSASESASGYDSLSSYSESFYNAANSPELALATDPTDFTFDFNSLNMDFHRMGVDRHPYNAASIATRPSPIMPNPTVPELAGALGGDLTSFGALPASPQRSHGGIYRPRSRSGAYSDYVPSHRAVPSSAASDYYPTLAHTRHPSLAGMPIARTPNGQRTVSPASLSPSSQSGQSDMSQAMPITPPLPIAPVTSRVHEALDEDEQDGPADARRKYKCKDCPRSFARAFNLKTHVATHDPNRPKPHVCPHKACGRSFSRKHDLGRHLVSIHRDEQGIPTGSVTVAAAGGHTAHHARSTNGSERGGSASVGPSRGWCSRCAQPWTGRDRMCACAANDIK